MTSAMSVPAANADDVLRYVSAVPSALAMAGAVHDLGNLIQVATSAINIVARNVDPLKSAVISTGIYHLMWDLAKNDLPMI